MDKIYTRNRRIKLPNFNFSNFSFNKNLYSNNNEMNNFKFRRIFKILLIIIIAIISANFIIKSINPIIDKHCINMAKVIATRVSNEQTTKVMSKYKYDDLCLITKDVNRENNND